MSKRTSENAIDFLEKQAKKLEVEIKRCRKLSSESSSSGSSYSSGSSSESCSTSRDSTPLKDQHAAEPKPPKVEGIDIDTETLLPEAPSAAVPAQSANVTESLPMSIHTPPVTSPDQKNSPVDRKTLETLGTDPPVVQQNGVDINQDLANRMQHIATSGLDKDEREWLIEKYKILFNFSKTAAPTLNPEIKALVPDSVIRRDKVIETRQIQIAAAINCLIQAILNQLNDKNTNHGLLKQLMDAARIVCDLQYGESVSRRNFVLHALSEDMKEQLVNAKIDSLLFGEDLPETLKMASPGLKSEVYRNSNLPKYASTKRPMNGQVAGPSQPQRANSSQLLRRPELLRFSSHSVRQVTFKTFRLKCQFGGDLQDF